MKTISLLHPFSAKAIGLSEQDLFFSHSKPHEKALLALQKEGYKVSIAYFTGKLFPFTKQVNGISKRFWPVTKPILKKRHGWRKQHSFFHYCASLFTTPDITIINMSGHGSPYCFKLAKMLAKKGKPYIAMVGGLHISENKKTFQYFNNAHHIIVHTEVQKQQLQQTDTFKNLLIVVMPLGIDTTVFIPKYKALKSFQLLFVGRISRLKQIELCIYTLAYLIENKVTNVSLAIVGPMSDAVYFEELKALATRLEVGSHITFAGSVLQKELVPYYQNANLLLLPSAHESFGMVMVEAMACGTPVAALKDAGGPDEIVLDKITGILATKETYAERILQYIQSEEMQHQFQTSSRLEVEKKWSLKQTEVALKATVNLVFS
ncbi:glycosyltransferase family 4 protein [Rasiella sp. SM2506]|uniref:glycosyltransferase family 4 protein n=1 Tax=Rasiella sp. SM2506 TaxID=3423914 RepID=UPI003D7981CD